MADDLRIDDLARESGTPSTTIRLYQNRGLLPGPKLVGRTGWYGARHLERLRLIGRLREEGFSLAGIGRLLATQRDGGGLADLVGGGDPAGEVLRERRGVTLEMAEALARFPGGSVEPADLQRAATLGLVEAAEDGRLRVPDERFLEAGAALARLGVPVAVILDEWAALRELTDHAVARFVAVFETHFLQGADPGAVGPERLPELAATLAQLARLAGQVTAAALDASLARVIGERLDALQAIGPESP